MDFGEPACVLDGDAEIVADIGDGGVDYAVADRQVLSLQESFAKEAQKVAEGNAPGLEETLGWREEASVVGRAEDASAGFRSGEAAVENFANRLEALLVGDAGRLRRVPFVPEPEAGDDHDFGVVDGVRQPGGNRVNAVNVGEAQQFQMVAEKALDAGHDLLFVGRRASQLFEGVE